MIILDKSNKDVIASVCLKEAECFAPSVHASYYGCFLLMKYIGNHVLSFPYNLQDDPENGNVSHDSLYQTIYAGCSRDMQRKLRSVFQTIHLMRRKADYTPIKISEEQADKTIQLTADIRTNLANFYNITL